ncbi:MAG TPA: sigma-54 dependent transcriptional regulator [Polyangiaceae bacterium]|nr:sigma-54 dependent transcriptional regulator [Polyangiaceae bacterium]
MSAIAGQCAVLVVDPDPSGAKELALLLAQQGMSVAVCGAGAEALAQLDRAAAQVILCELVLPDMSGIDLLVRVSERWPGLPVVLIAADASVPHAVSALKHGAADFIQKPLDPEEIRYVLTKALTAVERRADLPPPPPSSERAGLLGNSPAMRQVYATLERAAPGNATVLVRGESGTGKELIARAIHDASPRAKEPFVKIDCASLPEHLLESELFGYEKGAFTGAVARKPGRAELADRGTLFLDEIGELSLPLQAKLLRLLQDRQLERLGGTKTIKVDVRVVAATHRDLDGMIERGEFRQDLFYRLNVIPLWLPPLRARREDVEALAHHFCATCGALNGKPDMRLDKDAVRALRSQKWPGNVRQLQNFIERLVVLTPGRVIGEQEVLAELSRHVRFTTQPGTHASLPAALVQASRPESDAKASEEAPVQILTLDLELRAAERRALERALTFCKHNRSLAARLLGVSRSTLYAKLKEHELL